MSDPTGEIRTAVLAALKANAGVASAFGANKKRIYNWSPVSAARQVIAPPYIIVQTANVAPYLAECLDGAETEITVDIWSLTDPPGTAEAEVFAPVVQAALLAIDALPNHKITAAEPVRITYLIDPSDNSTAHAVVVVRFSTDPI